MSAAALESLSDKARTLYDRMSEDSSTFYETKELQKLINIKKQLDLVSILEELMQFKLIKPGRQGDVLKFRVVSVDDAMKVSNMTKDEAMIYSHIEASGREGIWTKTIKAKTNLHQHIVSKALKSLASQR